MTGLLAGKVAVVTGGAQGIGLAVGERFAIEGATVVLADVAIDAAQQQAERLTGLGGGPVRALHLDVVDETSVAAIVRTVRIELGGADIVVANAGILVLGHVIELALSDWQRVLDVNLTGVFLTCRDFARDMVEREVPGRILITSSLFGKRGGRENGAYSATKFGVLGLMESLAAEMAPRGVRVNAVCPGQILTEMNAKLLQDRAALTGQDPEQITARLLDRIPLGRLGAPPEVADAYVYLASELSSYVTGQTLVVDGGWEVA